MIVYETEDESVRKFQKEYRYIVYGKKGHTPSDSYYVVDTKRGYRKYDHNNKMYWLKIICYVTSEESALFVAAELNKKTDLKQHSISFHKWMKEEDYQANAENWFGYTDEEMYDEFLKYAE